MRHPLPPLANLFAFAALDQGLVEEVAADIEAGGHFSRVWRPHRHWVAASAPFPDGEPDSDEVRRGGFAFAEGRRKVVKAGDEFHGLDRLAGVVDSGGSRLASLDGDFGFIRFNRDGSATVVRSCGGLVPFYLWSGREAVAIATLLTDHARHIPGDVTIDPLVHATAMTLCARSPDNRSFLAGVRLLPRGHTATLSPRGNSRWERYWDPRPDSLSRPTPERAREHAARLREALVDYLAENLHPEGGNLLGLSGGVDSSSLAALAMGAANRPVATLSFLPASELDEARDLELSYIEPLLAGLGVEQRWFRPLGVKLLYDYVTLAAPEGVVHNINSLLCVLPEVMAELDVRVLVGGEFADETCGSNFTVPDWDDATSPWSLVRTYPSGFGTWRYPGRWVRRHLDNARGRTPIPYPAELPNVVRADLQPEYREWWDRQRREYLDDRRPWRYMNVRLERGQSWTEMNWEGASLLGVRRLTPFLTRDVLELAFSCHPSELIGPGLFTKKLLRTALSNDVPHHNLFRPDKGFWGDPEASVPIPWTEPLPEELGAVVRSDWIPQPPEKLLPVDCLRLRQVVLSVSALTRLRYHCATARPPGLGPKGASVHEDS